MAEGEGFKPPIPERGIPDFESSAIDHSANLPNEREQKRESSRFVEREESQLKLNLPSGLPLKIGCKGKVFF